MILPVTLPSLLVFSAVALFLRDLAEMQGIFGRFSPGTGSGLAVVVVDANVVVARVVVVTVFCSVVVTRATKL